MYRIKNNSARIEKFRLECGATISLRLAYQWIVPDCAVRRVVLLCHGITSSHEAFVAEPGCGTCPDAGWGNGFIGPGRALDPSLGDMILSINSPGSCFGSSGPGDDPSKGFPPLTMVDIATAHWRLADLLGIARIDQLIGYSFGGYVAAEMSCQQGSRIGTVLQLASSLQGRADPEGTAEITRIANLEPTERHRATLEWRRHNLERTGYSAWLNDRYGSDARARLDEDIERWASVASLEALLVLRAAAAGFDRRDTLVSPPMVMVRWDSDVLFPPEAHVWNSRIRCLTLHSRYGHAAPLTEPDKWTFLLRAAGDV